MALVLLISRGLQESGFVGLIGGQLSKIPLSENQFLLVILVTAAALSSFMNNIGAMAILLPVTIAVCQQNNWNPPKFLIAAGVCKYFGGMNTMIGTPPNIIISQYRETYTGT